MQSNKFVVSLKSKIRLVNMKKDPFGVIDKYSFMEILSFSIGRNKSLIHLC